MAAIIEDDFQANFDEIELEKADIKLPPMSFKPVVLTMEKKVHSKAF